jgi:hypothetical protein
MEHGGLRLSRLLRQPGGFEGGQEKSANAIATTTISSTPVAPKLKSRAPTSLASIPLPSFRSEPQRTAGIWGRKGKPHLHLRHRQASVSQHPGRAHFVPIDDVRRDRLYRANEHREHGDDERDEDA